MDLVNVQRASLIVLSHVYNMCRLYAFMPGCHRSLICGYSVVSNFDGTEFVRQSTALDVDKKADRTDVENSGDSTPSPHVRRRSRKQTVAAL